MTKPLPFTQGGLTRAIAAARKAGLRVTGIKPDGTLVVDDGDNHGADVSIVGPGAQGEDHEAALAKRWGDREQ